MNKGEIIPDSAVRFTLTHSKVPDRQYAVDVSGAGFDRDRHLLAVEI